MINQVLRAHKIRMKDLEERVLEEFMDPSSVPRVWEARFQYHLKKKQVKLQLIAKIVKEQRKKNEEEADKIRQEE